MAFYKRPVLFDIRPDSHRRLVGIGIYVRGMVDVSPVHGIIRYSGAGIYGNAAVDSIRSYPIGIYMRPYDDAIVNDIRRSRSSWIYSRTDCNAAVDDVGGRRSVRIYVGTYDYVAVNNRDF